MAKKSGLAPPFIHTTKALFIFEIYKFYNFRILNFMKSRNAQAKDKKFIYVITEVTR